MLGTDLDSYWVSIMNVFNLICPRPQLVVSGAVAASTVPSSAGIKSNKATEVRGGGTIDGASPAPTVTADSSSGGSGNNGGGFWATMRAKFGMKGSSTGDGLSSGSEPGSGVGSAVGADAATAVATPANRVSDATRHGTGPGTAVGSQAKAAPEENSSKGESDFD